MSGLVPELALMSSAAASWPTWWQVVTEFALFLAVASVIGGALTYLAVVRPVYCGPLALTAVGAVITSGSWLAWKHVGGVSELITTTYGRFLLVKRLLVFTLIAAGAYNQFLLTPRIARTHAARRNRKRLHANLALLPRHCGRRDHARDQRAFHCALPHRIRPRPGR